MEKTNLKKALDKVKSKHFESVDILVEVQKILEESDKRQDRVERNLLSGMSGNSNAFHFDKLKTGNIYHIEHIRKICIDYRLRFLDTKYFKGDIPQEAISKIKQLEKFHATELSGFKIIAPSKLFKLKDKDDPLLFAPIGNDYYYFIHKWGNDLHPFRKVFMWPYKNVVNLVLTVLVLSFLTTLITPIELFTKTTSGYEFWLLFFFMFKWALAVVLFYGFAKGKNFNHAIWKSRFLNS
ncbi:hypothetical protein [Maribacter polysaccharolyticus]|uniref:hypothetical protein n=1 Tax=Maribacter polysaccharolyticus TaxID=3020831 RepID=UPI0030841C34